MDVSEEQYIWNQNREYLSIVFKKPIEEINTLCVIKKTFLSVKLLDGTILLEGDLERDIDVEASKWFVVDKK